MPAARAFQMERGGDAVGVNVFRRFDQFGESDQFIAGRFITGAAHFHQNGVIALDDERVGGVEIGHICSRSCGTM